MNCRFYTLRPAALLLFLLPAPIRAQAPAMPAGSPSANPSVGAPAASAPTNNTLSAAPVTPSAPASSHTAPNGMGAAGGVSAPGSAASSPFASSGPVSPQVPLSSQPVTFASPSAPNAFGQPLPAAPPVSLQAVTPGAMPLFLTPDSTAILAARRSLGSLAALRDVFAARAGVKSAAALSPPVFTIGPALEAGGTTDGFLFEQPLELNGTRGARARIARAQLRLTEAQALTTLQAIVYTARTDFYILARAQEQLRLASELRRVTEQFDALARRQVALGARPGVEARQTAIEAARARVAEAQAAGEEQSARALLNAYLGRAPLDPVVAALPDQTPPVGAVSPAPDLEAAQRQALAARGEIAEMEATRDLPLARASLARAQGRPDLAPEFRIAQITPTYMDAGLGVVITVPLDYGTRRNLIRQEDRTADADADRIVGTQAQVRAETVQAASRLTEARAALAEYDGGIVADARAVLDSTRAGFAAGGLSIIEVLNAERIYRLVTNERLGALASVDQAAADFDRAVGAVPPALLSALTQDMTAKDIKTVTRTETRQAEAQQKETASP